MSCRQNADGRGLLVAVWLGLVVLAGLGFAWTSGWLGSSVPGLVPALFPDRTVTFRIDPEVTARRGWGRAVGSSIVCRPARTAA